MEFRTISAKLPRDEFTLVEAYCKKKKLTTSALIRQLLNNELDTPVPHHVAGKNKIVYNKEKDNFTWIITLDDGAELEVMKNVPTSYLEQLQATIGDALILRNQTLKKIEKSSVPVPSTLLRNRK